MKTLADQIKYCVEMGFDVSFVSSGMQMGIKVERHGLEFTSTLPKTDSHLTDERIAGAVKFGLDKVWNKLYPAKEKCCCEVNPDEVKNDGAVGVSNCCPIHNSHPINCQAEEYGCGEECCKK